MFSPMDVYPNGPVTNIKSSLFDPFLVTMLFEFPKMHTLKTISLPAFVSPPIIEIPYSLHAFLNPFTILSIFTREIVFGKFIEIIPYSGFTPFAAKSLTQAITLFLAASDNFIFLGMSVLSTIVSIFAIILVFPKVNVSTSSEINFLFPNFV